MTVRELHQLASRHIPRDILHACLHQAAVDHLGVESLTQLTPAQLDLMATNIRKLPLLKPAAAAPRPRRDRRGAPEGVIRLISDKQLHLIRGLACEMRWSNSTLTSFLKTHFGVDKPEDLATSARAGECINKLIGFKRQKERKARLKAAM